MDKNTLLYPPPTFTRKNDGLFLMELNNQYYTIDEEVKSVLQILSKNTTFQQASEEYNTFSGEEYSIEEFKYYADELLKKFSFEKKAKSFLLVEKIIIPGNKASVLAQPFTFLFHPILFWITTVNLLFFSCYALLSVDDHHQDAEAKIPLLNFMLIYFVTVLFHEIGHIAATKRFTGKTGGIGVGIYIIYPILYSNISAIWLATKSQKIITNLAGVHMQLGCAFILYLIGTYSGYHNYIDYAKAIIWICFIQLLPFVRSDGYWLLSDLTDTPNLLAKANNQLNLIFKNSKEFFKQITTSNLFLFIYAIINTAFVIFFICYQILVNHDKIVELPIYLLHICQQLLQGNWHDLKFESSYLQIILFYYLLFMYARKLYSISYSRIIS